MDSDDYSHWVGSFSSKVRVGLQSLRTSGFRETTNRVAVFVGQRAGLQPDLVQHRYRLGQILSGMFDHTIRYGPFEGTRLIAESHWSAADRGSMLLGMYEQELLHELVRLSGDRKVLIDVGAADGYYAVGALRASLFEHVVCFEITPLGQQVIEQQARKNSVLSRVTILGEAAQDFVDVAQQEYSFDVSNAVILMDIEGGEFELLSEALLKRIKDAVLIVEVHDFSSEHRQRSRDLKRRLGEYFLVSEVTQGERNPNCFEEISKWSDDDRWLLCSESRATRMRWFVCEPRPSTAVQDSDS